MIRITATPTPQSRKELQALASTVSRLQGIGVNRRQRSQIAAVIVSGFADNFDSERAGSGAAWAELAPATNEDRRRLGFDPFRPILHRTGGYRNTWTEPADPDHVAQTLITRDRIRIREGSDDYRVEFHEDGTPNMPARPARFLPQGRIDELGQVLERLVRQALERRD